MIFINLFLSFLGRSDRDLGPLTECLADTLAHYGLPGQLRGHHEPGALQHQIPGKKIMLFWVIMGCVLTISNKSFLQLFSVFTVILKVIIRPRCPPFFLCTTTFDLYISIKSLPSSRSREFELHCQHLLRWELRTDEISSEINRFDRVLFGFVTLVIITKVLTELFRSEAEFVSNTACYTGRKWISFAQKVEAINKTGCSQELGL